MAHLFFPSIPCLNFLKLLPEGVQIPFLALKSTARLFSPLDVLQSSQKSQTLRLYPPLTHPPKHRRRALQRRLFLRAEFWHQIRQHPRRPNHPRQ